MFLNDRQIRDLCSPETLPADVAPMISPFEPEQVKEVDGTRVVSYGTSSFGYDMRVANEFRIFTNANNTLIDPKAFDDNAFIDVQGDHVIIPPNSFILCRSMEEFAMPDDVMAICLGKSTYARCGLIVNVTPLEPGWTGHLTIEISNTTPLPAKLYAEEGVAQLLFARGERPSVTYRDRGGKYMGQQGVTTARV